MLTFRKLHVFVFRGQVFHWNLGSLSCFLWEELLWLVLLKLSWTPPAAVNNIPSVLIKLNKIVWFDHFISFDFFIFSGDSELRGDVTHDVTDDVTEDVTSHPFRSKRFRILILTFLEIVIISTNCFQYNIYRWQLNIFNCDLYFPWDLPEKNRHTNACLFWSGLSCWWLERRKPKK